MNNKRTALITGAASGIGLAAAFRMGPRCKLILVDKLDDVHTAADRLKAKGFEAESIAVDLARPDQITDLCQRVLATGGCDILVNNAGVHPKKDGRMIPVPEITLEEWDLVFRINVTAPFLLAQQFLPGMEERNWGRVINVASRAARSFTERVGIHYAASKTALVGMNRTFAGHYAPFGITCNCVAPGQAMTPLARTSSDEVLAAAVAATPRGKMGTADEVASTIEYLATDDAAFITGAVIDVNGGTFMT